MPKDRRDGRWGIYLFKRGFGGELEYYVGAFDFVYHPALYSVTQLVARYSSVDALARLSERFPSRLGGLR